jgi:hypothetical protein
MEDREGRAAARPAPGRGANTHTIFKPRAGSRLARRPRTTMRYDRARGSLDRHATYAAAAYLAGAAR